MIRLVLTGLTLLLALPLTSAAQELPKAKKFTDAHRHLCVPSETQG